MKVQGIRIHEFLPNEPECHDVDGELLLGFYYQFTDADDRPLFGLIGPYRHRFEVEGAARVAFDRQDY